MRAIVLSCALLLPFAAVAQDMPPPGGHRGPAHGPGHGPGRGEGPQRGGGRLFISPMGEPFHSVKGDPDPQDMWFAAADTNHDTALTRAEFEADAMRFFQVLDRKHDGEIDPEDLEYYETVLAPEIRVAAGGWGGTEGSGADGASKPVYPDRQGAARYGYFSFPEPVSAADTNFNRGVDWQEFRKAANDRFDVLDTNGDGKIDHAELPKIAPPRPESGRGGGPGPGDGKGRGGGRRGGMGGGGMGGGGMGGGGMDQPGGGFGQQ